MRALVRRYKVQCHVKGTTHPSFVVCRSMPECTADSGVMPVVDNSTRKVTTQQGRSQLRNLRKEGQKCVSVVHLHCFCHSLRTEGDIELDPVHDQACDYGSGLELDLLDETSAKVLDHWEGIGFAVGHLLCHVSQIDSSNCLCGSQSDGVVLDGNCSGEFLQMSVRIHNHIAETFQQACLLDKKAC